MQAEWKRRKYFYTQGHPMQLCVPL